MYFTNIIFKGLGRLPKMNSYLLNWSTGKETSAAWEVPKRAGLGSVIVSKNALISMKLDEHGEGMNFPLKIMSASQSMK